MMHAKIPQTELCRMPSSHLLEFLFAQNYTFCSLKVPNIPVPKAPDDPPMLS
jgi:hypothetical protein